MSDYDFVCKQIETAASGGGDTSATKADVFWAVVEGATSIVDGATGTSFASIASTGGKSIYETITASTDGFAPNPWFVFNGHADRPIDCTKKYFRGRRWKKLGGGVFGIAGKGASAGTQVDVAGILKHGQATALSGAHLAKLHSIAKRYRQSETLSKWIELLMKMKAIKASVRGTELAGAAIPVPAVSAIAGIGAGIAKVGVKLTYAKLCLVTSADIHWRAFQEQRISGGLTGRTGKIGPASQMFHEIFTKRGATLLLGRYDIDRLIDEPTGWLALNDKLMLV